MNHNDLVLWVVYFITPPPPPIVLLLLLLPVRIINVYIIYFKDILRLTLLVI